MRDEKSALAVPNHSLCAFQRIALASGECKTITLKVAPCAFTVVTEDGLREKQSDSFKLFVGLGQPDARTRELSGQAALEIDFKY